MEAAKVDCGAGRQTTGEGEEGRGEGLSESCSSGRSHPDGGEERGGEVGAVLGAKDDCNEQNVAGFTIW